MVYVLAAALISSKGWAQTSTSNISVTGEADLAAGAARSAAYKSALDAGLRQAVGQYILQKLGGDEAVFAEKKPTIESKILPNANLYVRNYQIQNEQIRDGKIFLKIQTEILGETLKRDLLEAGVLASTPTSLSSAEVELVVHPGANYRRLVLVRKFLGAHPEWVKAIRTAELMQNTVVLAVELSPAANVDGLAEVLAAESFSGAKPKVSQVSPQKLEVVF